jgi:hypothetical protein
MLCKEAKNCTITQSSKCIPYRGRVCSKYCPSFEGKELFECSSVYLKAPCLAEEIEGFNQKKKRILQKCLGTFYLKRGYITLFCKVPKFQNILYSGEGTMFWHLLDFGDRPWAI